MEHNVFTRDSLAQSDGKQGQRAYVAYEGKVHDVTESVMWKDGEHQGEHSAGADLTAEIGEAPHFPDELEKSPIVGST